VIRPQPEDLVQAIQLSQRFRTFVAVVPWSAATNSCLLRCLTAMRGTPHGSTGCEATNPSPVAGAMSQRAG
jgi:hypothetical protein